METNQYKKIITRRPNGSRRVQTINTIPSKTDQQYGDETDVNQIVEKYMRTGELSHTRNQQGVYADTSEIPDLLGATLIVQEANEKFAELPADVREKFQNNPINMMDYLAQEKNRSEAEELGLINRRPKTEQNDKPNDDIAQNIAAKKQDPPPAKPDQKNKPTE